MLSLVKVLMQYDSPLPSSPTTSMPLQEVEGEKILVTKTELLIEGKKSQITIIANDNNRYHKTIISMYHYYLLLFSSQITQQAHQSIYICGLTKSSTSCSMNSVLQCFVHTKPLREFIIDNYGESILLNIFYSCGNVQLMVKSSLMLFISLSLIWLNQKHTTTQNIWK